ncbi:MAG: hypothetical protein QF363_10090 [Planctomycetaceae bacterium]|jgi:hypothetical protein|nr:hypothetical protein [Planctomycetaceae bacterium]
MGAIKRWLVSLVIGSYLGSLGYGIACHALDFNTSAHPSMYFVVWDMFCGWSAYSNRLHLVAEGESGRYYQVAPAPWTSFHPYGNLPRHQYDPFLNHTGTVIRNCLEKTRHEPIQRVLVIEEVWAKKYNLPDPIWSRFFDGPRERHSYFQVRQVVAPDGKLVRKFSPWLSRQSDLFVSVRPLPSFLDSDSMKLSPALQTTTRPFDPSAVGLPATVERKGSGTLFPPVDPQPAPLAQ